MSVFRDIIYYEITPLCYPVSELQMTTSNPTARWLSRLRLRHLQLLALLDKEPNVARCAKDMHVSQPTASKLLREIEAVLGASLFTRNRRGLQPTPAGIAMTRRAALIVDELDASQTELALALQGATGHLRLGVFPVATPRLLMQTRERVLGAVPDLVVSIHEGVEGDLLGPLSDGHLDCVLGRIVPNLLSSDLRYEVLYHESTVIVCGPDHPIVRAQKKDRLRWLGRSEWSLPALRGAPYNMVSSLLAHEHMPPPRVTTEAVSVSITLKLLCCTTLLSILPEATARELAQAKLLTVVPVPLPASMYPVGVIYRDRAARSPLVRAVIEAAHQATAEL